VTRHVKAISRLNVLTLLDISVARYVLPITLPSLMDINGGSVLVIQLVVSYRFQPYCLFVSSVADMKIYARCFASVSLAFLSEVILSHWHAPLSPQVSVNDCYCVQCCFAARYLSDLRCGCRKILDSCFDATWEEATFAAAGHLLQTVRFHAALHRL